jgi:hypothetical protein
LRVSVTTRDVVEGSGLTFENRGMHELKGFSGPRQLFAVVPTIHQPTTG